LRKIRAALRVHRGQAVLTWFRVHVTTGSMAPTLPVGATPRVVPARPAPGDVFVFRRRSGALVTHRLVARLWLPAVLGGARWVQAGDAHPSRATLIRESQLLGRVESPSRPFGRLARIRLGLRALLEGVRSRML
jgi:hypothetical protein